MANPTATFYTVGSGQTVYGGLRNYPSWRENQAPFTWVEIPTANTLSSINPSNNPAINPRFPLRAEWNKSPADFERIITAWCGGCYDQVNDVLWLPLQGGHADYAGNEPYKIALNADNPVFVMVRNPSGAVGNVLTTDDGQEGTGVYTDGRPRSIHSYNKPVYVPNVGPFITVQGGTSWSGQSGTQKTIFIDPDTGEHNFKATYTGDSGPFSGGSAYDSSRHAIWWRGAGTGQFGKYLVNTDTWSYHGPINAISGYSALEYLPDDDCVVWFNDQWPDGIRIFDCVTSTVHTPSVTGTSVGTQASGHCRPYWVPELNGIVYWDNSSSAGTLNILNKPANPRTGTWTISQLTLSPANTVTPSVRTPNGTYGRFAYSPNLKGFVVLNAVTQKPYFFALD